MCLNPEGKNQNREWVQGTKSRENIENEESSIDLELLTLNEGNPFNACRKKVNNLKTILLQCNLTAQKCRLNMTLRIHAVMKDS